MGDDSLVILGHNDLFEIIYGTITVLVGGNLKAWIVVHHISEPCIRILDKIGQLIDIFATVVVHVFAYLMIQSLDLNFKLALAIVGQTQLAQFQHELRLQGSGHPVGLLGNRWQLVLQRRHKGFFLWHCIRCWHLVLLLLFLLCLSTSK